MIGKVKWFNSTKGFGFIQREGAKDLFVHFSGIKSAGFKTLEEGALVEYDVIRCELGEQATNVVQIEK